MITLALFHNQEGAENAINELSRNGFALKDIQVVMKNKEADAHDGEDQLGKLINLGLSQEEALIYEIEIKAGAILLGVPFYSASAVTIQDILERHKASQIRLINRNSQ